MSAAPLNVWVIFDCPEDYPQHFVARRFELDQPTDEVIVAPPVGGLAWLRAKMFERGLCQVGRDGCDAPQIVECWL